MNVIAVLLVAMARAAGAAANADVGAALDGDGARLVITRSQGKPVQAPKIEGQVGFDTPMISEDWRTAGWQALHANCCTTYPLPRTLVVQSGNGRLHLFRGAQAIFGWCFVAAPGSAELPAWATGAVD